MHYRPNQSRYRRLLISAVMAMLTLPLQAHKVELDGSIGATLHIEPNDTPRAGEPALAWFALTRRGGQSVPLADCNCQLAVFSQAQRTPILEPELAPVSAEGYEDIPGAEVTFPEVGAYELVLTGAPASGDGFDPFELRFSVTVAVGQTATPEPLSPEVTTSETNPPEPPQSEINLSEAGSSGEVSTGSGDARVRSHVPLTIGIGFLATAAGISLAILRRK